MRLVLRRFGLDPERDVRLIPVGGTSQAIAALSNGLIQFSLSNEPFVREAEKLGFKSIVDVGSLRIPFHWNAVIAPEAVVRSKRSVMLGFVRAMTRAIYIYKTEKAWVKTVIARHLRLDDPESLQRTYRSYVSILPEISRPTIAGVKTLLDDLASRAPKAAVANAKDFVDPSLVDEVERSGFIKRPYGR